MIPLEQGWLHMHLWSNMYTILKLYLNVAGGCFCAGFDLKALAKGELDPLSYHDPNSGTRAAMVRI